MSDKDSQAVRTLIVDDHPVVRFGVKHILDAETDIEVVGDVDKRDVGRGRVGSHRVVEPGGRGARPRGGGAAAGGSATGGSAMRSPVTGMNWRLLAIVSSTIAPCCRKVSSAGG